ncbi:MAG: aminotransferase class I/II-fold pyridoxal phosphate-dependent enzyme [SAR324 cluster bacterium]|nr:aminotransferase class I/II-fold pyridoxal phosphate-dependent enzyme [SAR324 cluster bacterium]
MLKVSNRSQISSFIVMDVMQSAAEQEALGREVLHLEVGQPSTPAPEKVLQTAKKVFDQDKLGYTVALGIDPLRERIARHYQDFYNICVSTQNIVVTSGSTGGFILAFLTAFNEGDRVVYGSPGYPCYRNILTALGIEPVEILTGPETRFQPTPELIEQIEEPVDGLIVASPANPTGTMIDNTEMETLSNYCQTKGIRLISDEIYHGITYQHPAVSAYRYSKDAIILNSFSKYFSMTGWRLGWMIIPDNWIRPIECLAQNFYISPHTLSQIAGTAAFDCYEEINGHVARYAKNREILLNELPSAGLDKLAPADGAFYIYADISHLTDDSTGFCSQLLVDTGVAATPGIDFDPSRGHQTMRFSFCGKTHDMIEAAKQLKSWIGQKT